MISDFEFRIADCDMIHTRPMNTIPSGVIVKLAGLTIAYFIAGRLGLLLAVPPGYAAAIFPASGVALAGLLLYGYRFWPAVWLGSFLINLSLSFDPSSALSVLKSLIISAGIGFGAAVQALLSTFLIKRFVGFPNPLERLDHIARFFILGAPVGCLTSASIGTATLITAGVMSSEGLFVNWLTWWVGDAIGVIIVTPIILIWKAEPAEAWRQRRISVALPLVFTFILSVMIYIYANGKEERRIESEFKRQAEIIAFTIQSEITLNVNIIQSIGGFFRTSETVDRKKFRSFVEGPLSRNKGIKVLSWVPRVSYREMAEYEQEAEQDGYYSFTINERDPEGNLIPALKRAEYFPIYYLEPYQGNEKALGFDLGSDVIRSVALKKAKKLKSIVATDRLMRVQDNKNRYGFLFILPVFADTAFTRTEERGDTPLRGYITGGFILEELIDRSLG
ncbi:MAG: CHASE domain-containing protein, partial [Syntrophales bacterium LBB04]|nr:CHASE domain-containing protein [Syntrophales bacterium LBB04]